MNNKITYSQIQEKYKESYNRTIKTCWIADIKRKCGLPVKVSSLRSNPNLIKNYCPVEKESGILSVLRSFKLID